MDKRKRVAQLKRLKMTVIRLLPVLLFGSLWLAGCGGLAPGSINRGTKQCLTKPVFWR